MGFSLKLNSKNFLIQLILSILLILTSCATIEPVVTDKEGQSERKYVKNYTIGKIQTCYVGEPVVKVVDYYVRKVSTDKLKATNDFVISGGPLMYRENIAGKSDTTYRILGTAKYGGNEFYAVNFDGNPTLRHFITKSGEFSGNACDASGTMRSPPYFHVKPAATRFLRYEEERIETNKGYVNYEILYTGKTESSINLLYREFTSTDLARPAFFQNLTYAPNAKVIRFKKVRLAIKSANNEMLVYNVIEDGL